MDTHHLPLASSINIYGKFVAGMLDKGVMLPFATITLSVSWLWSMG